MALGVSARCLTWRSQDGVQGGREMLFSRLGAADAALPTRERLLELVQYRRSDGMRHNSDNAADSESRLIAPRRD
jgi:hypothetical protein